MQVEKLLKKIKKSFSFFLVSSLKNEKFDFVFEIPKMTIKWNMKSIDKDQIELKNLANKHPWFVLNTVKTMKWTLVESVKFCQEKDYLNFLWKNYYYKTFQKNLDIIFSSNISHLLFWEWNFKIFLEKNILKVVEFDGKWWDILKGVEYFLQNKNSNLYFRELPIEVHTKFIEKNKKIISDIMDFLYEELHLDLVWDTFEEKFWIKIKPEFVRFRFLDIQSNQSFFWNIINDISMKIDDFQKINIEIIQNIYIVENEINYLTFPHKEKSMVIWWAWFNVLNLKNIDWFHQKNIYYFWDIDSHGFKILAHFRKYFNHTKSIFMDINTFDTFRKYTIEGKTITKDEMNKLKEYLTPLEYSLLSWVNKNNLRLEQENITQEFIYKYY